MSDEVKSSQVTIQIRGRYTNYEVLVSLQVPREKLKETIAELAGDLREAGIGAIRADRSDEREEREESPPAGTDTPYDRLARELEADAASLRKLVGIKGDSIQLYKASQFKIADAVCFICFAYEKALGHASMPYEVLTTLLQASQIKMKTPASVMCFNLINDGYFQRKPYDDERKIVLEAKGEQKARIFARQLTGGSYQLKEPRKSGKKKSSARK